MATRTEPGNPPETPDRALLVALESGAAQLRAQAAQHSPSWADPDDALQDACLAFLRAYDGPPGPDALRYLMVAVRSCAWALGSGAAVRHADERPLSTTDAFDPETPPVRVACERPGPAERAERRERVRHAGADLNRLKRDERAALLLFGLGFSYAEIAARRGWTATKVNRCLAEGRARLRALAAN